jgi:hypothetical protein
MERREVVAMIMNIGIIKYFGILVGLLMILILIQNM